MVALGAGILCLTLVWGLVSGLTRSFASNRDSLTSLQGAHLLVEYLKNDLSSCYFSPGTHPVENPDPFNLSFYVFDPEENSASSGRSGIELTSPKAVLRKISYRFDPAASVVSRNGQPFKFARFENVVFVFIGPNFSKQPKQYGNYVTTRVTCAPENVIEQNKTRDAGSRITKNVVTLITSVSIQHKASREIFPVWSPAPEPVVEVE